MKALAAIALFAAACAHADGGNGYDYGSEGAALYTQMCAVCHGEVGEGGIGPRLQDSAMGKSELASVIDQRMPAADPERCAGDCADKVASFIAEGLTASALTCRGVAPSPRRLRLLTRREYENTVRDLFGVEPGAPAQRFSLDLGDRQATTVHVAGDFNNWAATVAEGGLALSPDGGNRWSGSFSIPAGSHSYKFVIDESEWIADPANPETEPDGFGGQNSLVEVAPGLELALPVETRPEGFPFDDDAESGLVTAPHVDASVAAARAIAARVAGNLAPEALVDELGPKIFRRPLSAMERARYLGIASTQSPRLALEAMLVSPNFLYRSEIGEPDGDTYRLTGYEMATALSYMFWATTPDDELLAAAGRGDLDDAAGVEAQARRLLADERSREVVGELGVQWLGAEEIETATRSETLFPGFTETVRGDMLAQLRQLVAGAERFDDLYTAAAPAPSAALASFLGGGGDRSAGILTAAAVPASWAHSDQTAPIRRGLFVRQRLLCEQLPPPPPNAGGIPPVDPDATTRERFAQHTASEFCRGCHQYLDGVGFGFERFDAAGRFRETDGGKPVDASGEITDLERLGSGTSFSFESLGELGGALAQSEAARSCFVRQMVRFERGYHETLEDRCARLDLEERFAAAGGDIGELMVQIALSPAFRERK